MQKGFGVIYILVGVLILAVVSSGAYYLGRQNYSNSGSSTTKACTQEAKICPDGLSVGRTGPNCEFTACPTSQSTPIPDASPAPNGAGETANWKTYTSSKANYSFKYPSEWPLVVIPISSGCDACIEDIDFTPNYIPNLADTTLGVIIVNKEPKIQSLDDYVNIHVRGDESKINLNYPTLGGEKAISYKLSGGIPPLPIIEYAVVKNGYQYILRIEDSIETNKNRDKNIQIFNQILSTFKFL